MFWEARSSLILATEPDPGVNEPECHRGGVQDDLSLGTLFVFFLQQLQTAVQLHNLSSYRGSVHQARLIRVEVQSQIQVCPAVAIIQQLEDLLVRPACCRLDVRQEARSCEQVDVCILWGTERGAQADWGGRRGRGYTYITPAHVTAVTDRYVLTHTALPSRPSVKVGRVARVALCRCSLISFKGVQWLLRKGEDTRWSLHVQEIHRRDRLDQIQVSRTRKKRVPFITCNNNPFWHLHHSCVNGQGLLKWQGTRLLLWGHLERLWDSHALADTLCVLQLIMDAVHFSHLCRGGREGWPTHPAAVVSVPQFKMTCVRMLSNLLY